jgi:hypothetical protein
MWYTAVVESYSGIQKWVEDEMETGYDKTKELAGEIEKTVDAKKDGSISQMLIILSISSFFTGMLFGLRGTSDRKVRKALRMARVNEYFQLFQSHTLD